MIHVLAGPLQRSKQKGERILLTADHGNAEQMLENGEPMTAHTTNPVPFILVMDNAKGIPCEMVDWKISLQQFCSY